MQRRRRLDKFPTPEIDDQQVLEDIRSREYLSKFTEYHVRTVFYLALLGMTDEQMAVVFDISLSAFCSWKNKFPSFNEAIKKGKEQADAQAVYNLYQLCIGYEHPSEQIFCSKEKKYGQVDGKTVLLSEKPKIIRVPITKKYPPNEKAIEFWLKHRQQAMWSDKKDKNPRVTLNQFNFDMKGLSLEELKVLQKLQAQNNMFGDENFMTTPQRELRELNMDN